MSFERPYFLIAVMMALIAAQASCSSRAGVAPTLETSGVAPTLETTAEVDGGKKISVTAEAATVLTVLQARGFRVTYEGESEAGGLQFSLSLALPNDHNDPGAGTHDHNISLLHRDHALPMSMVSTGYGNYLGFEVMDTAALLGGNQVVVDKRFHNGQGDDWTLFTRKQVAADMHLVVDRLDDLYTGPWLNTGYSNGGIDAVVFQTLYAEDVVGTVNFGAPFLDARDERFLQFFKDADPSCQAKLEAIQRAVLGARRAEVEPAVASKNTELKMTFERVGHARAYEAAALSYPWLFWQYLESNDDCEALVDPDTASQEALTDAFYSAVMAFDMFPMSDVYLKEFGTFFYEAQRDSGWPQIPRDALERDGLIPADLVDMEVGLVPEGVTPPRFDAQANAALREIATHGDGVIFIYSASDPWSVGAIEPSRESGNVVYWVTSGSHKAGIEDLSEADRAAVTTQIKAWIHAE